MSEVYVDNFIIALVIYFLLCCFYFALFNYFKKGWKYDKSAIAGRGLSEILQYSDKAGAVQSDFSRAEIAFSILIPARNEERNIIACLESLLAQNYSPELFEIIVLDDHSEDNTAVLVNEFISRNPKYAIRIARMSDYPKAENSYKKAAINKGIELSKYDWIITTDADCTRGISWLKTIADFITEKDPVFISAPVDFKYDNSFFQQAQALEFLGLIAIGAACINMGNPILANGANIIYRKSAFHTVGGYNNIDNIASGDDELLMHKIHKQFPGGVHFLKSREALVYTHPCFSLAEFIQQRKRWVSKSTHYSNKRITLILALSYLFNLGILAGFVLSFFMPALFQVFLIMAFVKIITEYTFYRKVLPFFEESKLLKWCIPASMLHIVYVIFIGIYGNFGTYKWKGRKVK